MRIKYVVILTFFLVLTFHSKWQKFLPEAELNPEFRNELVALAMKSLSSRDVPVAALLVYKNEIIGRGFNTVNRDSLAGGHAEINAISDAMKNDGVSYFKNLNRDSLLLISTYEPCRMCSGAILEYGIKHIWFIKEKSLWSNWIEDFRYINYFARRRTTNTAALQDSLFQLHFDFFRTDLTVLNQ